MLAQDRAATAVALQFRYLQDPPDPAWLRRQARARLSARDRRDPEQVALMQAKIRRELSIMHRRLAERCGVPYADWQARAARIDRRVTELANLVNERRLARHAAQQPPVAEATGFASLVSGLFSPPEPLPPAAVVIAEQTAFHRLASDVPANLAAEIKARPKDFPGVQIVEHTTRDYPTGGLAAHVVGHVGRRSGIESRVRPDNSPQEVDDVVGLLGIERMLDAQLGGVPGENRQSIDHRGKVLGATVQREPAPGRDAVLSIDAELERAAEVWLDQATHRPTQGQAPEHGGAIVVLDVHSGEVLTAASALRFDPNLLVSGDPQVEAVLADPGRPLFDRTTKMAIPPGSVFKPLVALALVSEGAIDPLAALHCQGYLDDPEQLRCQIFRPQGLGHGNVTLSDALAQSCNVYFFEQVAALGGPRLVEWATRFGFGQETTVELPDESAGQLPNAADLRVERQVQSLAIGQATLTATPLQVARLYAAIANGGRLVTPRITRDRTAQSRTSRAPTWEHHRRREGARAEPRRASRGARGSVSRGRRPQRHGVCHGPRAGPGDCRQDRHGRDRRQSARPRLVCRLRAGRRAPLCVRRGAGARRQRLRISRSIGEEAGRADARARLLRFERHRRQKPAPGQGLSGCSLVC